MSDLKKVSGVVENLKTWDKEGRSGYSFGVADSFKSFSGFGEPDVEDGEEVTFKYEEKAVGDRVYNNVRFVYKPDQPEESALKQTQEIKQVSEPILTDFSNKLLMASVVSLAIKKGEFEEEYILAVYRRLLSEANT